eukprot:10599665-Karenia_brevis.AAC.1
MILGSRRRTAPAAVEYTSMSEGSDVDSNHGSTISELFEGEEENCMEPWSEWLKRTTHHVEEQLQSIGIEDW